MSLIKFSQFSNPTEELSNSIRKYILKNKTPKIKSLIGSQNVIVSKSMMENPLICDHAWGREE